MILVQLNCLTLYDIHLGHIYITDYCAYTYICNADNLCLVSSNLKSYNSIFLSVTRCVLEYYPYICYLMYHRIASLYLLLDVS